MAVKYKYPKETIIRFIRAAITEDYRETTSEEDGSEWVNVNSIYYDDTMFRLGFNISECFVYDFKQGFIDFEEFVAECVEIDEGMVRQYLLNLMKKDGKFAKDRVQYDFKAHKDAIETEIIDLPNLTGYHLPQVKRFTPAEIASNPLANTAWKYLIFNRGFNASHIKDYGLAFIDERLCNYCYGSKEVDNEQCPSCKGTGNNRYYGRIFIPTYEGNRLVYFQARDFLDREKAPRYLNPKVPRTQVVYFLDRIIAGQRVYIFEGPIDAMYFGGASVAVMGNRISTPQIKKILSKNPSEIVFVPDKDSNPDTAKTVAKKMANGMYELALKDDTQQIRIGLWDWHELSDKKDVNAAKLTMDDVKSKNTLWSDQGNLDKYFRKFGVSYGS
jgi:hypothetical protein